MGSGISHIRAKAELDVNTKIKIGVDEAGRGPLFGRVYAAAVVLPEDFDASGYKIHDSKRYHTKNSLQQADRVVRKVALSVGVGTASEEEIDTMNIRKATFLAMHRAIDEVVANIGIPQERLTLLVDGNCFAAYSKPVTDGFVSIDHKCIVRGDTKEPCISAASIVAKVARDSYIETLCDDDPELDHLYSIRSNKGYGTVHHMAAIREHGISKYHRKTFRPCRVGRMQSNKI